MRINWHFLGCEEKLIFSIEKGWSPNQVDRHLEPTRSVGKTELRRQVWEGLRRFCFARPWIGDIRRPRSSEKSCPMPRFGSSIPRFLYKSKALIFLCLFLVGIVGLGIKASARDKTRRRDSQSRRLLLFRSRIVADLHEPISA